MIVSLDFEKKVTSIKSKIFNLAKESNTDPEILIAAISDILGYTAAQLDKYVNPLPLEVRLQSVLERTKQSYSRSKIGLNV